VTNTLAYQTELKIVIVKSFVVLTFGVHFVKGERERKKKRIVFGEI